MSSVLGVLASLQTALPCARSCRESSSKTEVKALSFRHVYVSTIVATFLLILQIISRIALPKGHFSGGKVPLSKNDSMGSQKQLGLG